MYQMNSKKLVDNTQYITVTTHQRGSEGERRYHWSTHHVSMWRDVKQYVIIGDWLKTHSNGKNSITYCFMDMHMREIRDTVISLYLLYVTYCCFL